MKNLVKLAGAAALVLLPVQANAVTGDVPFNGSVTHTCTITVNSSGTLGVSTDFQSLDSEEVGGAAGTATIVATGNGFDISADAPTSFDTKPVADTTSNTFAANYATTGATSIGQTSGTNVNDLNHGTTNVTVHMSADKSGADVFEAGAYSATVVLRCE